MPNPRPRTPRFRPPVGPALLALYPLHVALAGLVLGLVAGPRAPAVVAGAVVAGAGGAAALRGSRAVLRVPVERAEDAELDRVVPDRPAFEPVPLRRAGTSLGAAAVAALGGGALADERLRALDATALRPAAAVRVTGHVLDPPRVRSYGTTVVRVRLTSVGGTRRGAGETVVLRAPDRVRVPRVGVGDELAARGRLRRLGPREDLERRRGAHAVVEAEAVAATGRTRGSPVDAVRRRAEAALERGLGAEEAALARGMVLGQDHALPEDLRDAFRTAGLAHLLAASGQNVMLLATLVLALATAAGVMLRARLALAVAAIAFYVPLAGAGPSIQRAGVMGAAGLVAALASRPASRWYALLLAAAATLALDPRAVEDVGWQLSFAAVIAILALYGRLRRALRGDVDEYAILAPSRFAVPAPASAVDAPAPPGRAGPGPSPRVELRDRRRLAVARVAAALDGRAARRARFALVDAAADAGALTIAATAGTAPLLCLHFGELSLVSLPANLLAAPAVAPVMWLGTLAGVLGGDAAVLLDAAASVPLRYLGWLARTAARVPHASVAVQLPGALGAVAAYAALAAACAVRLGDRPRRWLVAAGLARHATWGLDARIAGERPGLRPRWATIAPLGLVATGSVLLLAPGPPAPPAGPVLSLLDVGQGDAVLLQDGERAALFDTGRPGAPLVRELRAAGVARLDVLVLTHSSADHEGGLDALLRAIPVGFVLDGRGPGLERGGEGGSGRFEGLPPGLPRAVPERGQRFAVGRIAVEVLWPPPGEPRRGDPNLTATVAVARTATTSALLTADAESEVTLPLDLPDVDVLKVAHHGSADPGLPALLDRTTPRTALIPVGANTYGHPAPETLAALRTAVPDVRRTDRDGTVRVALGRP